MNVAWAAVWAAAGAVAAVVAVTVWARARYARRLVFFPCRIGPPVIRWRRRARWRIGRRRVAWAGSVLLMPSGLLRMFLTPVATGLPQAATVRPLAAEQARGLGAHPVSLLLTTDAGKRLEIAVPQAHAEDVVGPFLTAAFLELPPAPREQGG